MSFLSHFFKNNRTLPLPDVPVESNKLFVRKNGSWVDLDSNEVQEKSTSIPSSTNPLTIARGGTGADTKEEACTNLGAVQNTGDETIEGTKTFSSSPVVPTPASSDNSTKAASTAFVNSAAIIKSGARGQLAGNETAKTLSGSQTINASSSDTIVMNTSGSIKLTFTAAAASVSAIKVISLTASSTTTLTISGAVWANAGSAPTWGTAGKHLVLVAHFIGGRVVLTVSDNDQG